MISQPVPELEDDALRSARRRWSHLQIIASAGSGKTDVLGRPAVVGRVHENVTHPVVDEYQIYSPAQERLVCMLTSPDAELRTSRPGRRLTQPSSSARNFK